jgi:hypothetical protein
MAVFLLALLFESSLFGLCARSICCRKIFKGGKIYKPIHSRREAFCDDLYDLLDARYLVRQYERARNTKNEFIEYQGRRQHLPEFEAFREKFQDYLARAIEKERQLATKLRELSLQCGWIQFPDMETRCERIIANINKANSQRDARLRSPLQSYALSDNEQYVAILALQEVLAVSDPTAEADGAEGADPEAQEQAN